MPNVVVQSAAIHCVHGGTVMLKPSQTKLTVTGQAAILRSDLLGASISACTNTNTQLSQKPCLTVTSVIAGVATKLTVDGQGVLLDTAQGLTDCSPPQPVLWTVQSAGQEKLRAV